MPRRHCLDCGNEIARLGARTAIRCYPCSRARHEVTSLARKMTKAAISNGRLIRKPCEVCGARKVDAHHDDYARPLMVRWLCRSHHQQLHAELNRRA